MKLRLLIPSLAVVGATLAACNTNNDLQAFDVSSPEKAAKVECTKIHDVSNELSRLANLPDGQEKFNGLRHWGFNDPQNHKQDVTDVTQALARRSEDCNKSSSSATATTTSAPSSSAAPAPAQTGQVTVANADGQLEVVQAMSGSEVGNGDTRNRADMPAVSKLLPDCGVFKSWADPSACEQKHNAAWYATGADRVQPYTGFDWATVQKWATAKTCDKGQTPLALAIWVYGWTPKDISPEAAHARVAGLLNEAGIPAELQSQIQVRYFGTFMNTWRTNGDQPSMTTGADYDPQVRVSLVPLVLDSQRGGCVVGIDVDSGVGIFIDCYNIHGFYPVVPERPNLPPLCPPGTRLAGTPIPTGGVNMCNPGVPPPPKHTCPPWQPHGTWPVCKDDGSKDPAPNGNAGGYGGRVPAADPTASPPSQQPGGGANGSPPASPTPTTVPRTSTGTQAPPTATGAVPTNSPGTSIPPQPPGSGCPGCPTV